jgi:hypothetical protein
MVAIGGKADKVGLWRALDMTRMTQIGHRPAFQRAEPEVVRSPFSEYLVVAQFEIGIYLGVTAIGKPWCRPQIPIEQCEGHRISPNDVRQTYLIARGVFQ